MAHESFLSAFWEEEPEFSDYSSQQKNRHQIPRKKIRSYLAKLNGDGDVDHAAIAVSGYLSRLYSGFVHAAAPQCLDLFDPEHDTFRVSGYPESPLSSAHFKDFENQFYRGVISIFYVATALQHKIVQTSAHNWNKKLEAYFV